MKLREQDVLKSAYLISTGKDTRQTDKFQLTFPLRTNYMYAKAKRSLPEMLSLTVCLWIKSNASPGVGTPFSYAVPGQANELVLMEWGNNPMEILINDKVNQTDCKQVVQKCTNVCGPESELSCITLRL